METRRAVGDREESRWPLVGRDDELAVAAEAVRRGRGVVLTGSAGVGKTRLARELAAQAEIRGARVEWVIATETAARVPLGAVAHLVPRAELGGDRETTLTRIAAGLQRADGERFVLGVDDAHLLDDGSAVLVHLLAMTGAAVVVATVRSGEPVPDAIVSLWKDCGATLIALQSLARDEVEQLVTSVLGGTIDGVALQLLWEASAGNALYLRELVQHGLESGALRDAHGLWRWHGSIRAGERLSSLIAMRMGALSDDDLAALALVALGEPLPVECLAMLDVAGVTDRLEDRGLVVTMRQPRPLVTMAHPLFGEVVRARLPQSRLDHARLRLAEALEAVSDVSSADLFRAALWRAEAGDHGRPQQLRAAARRALALWASPVAERLARAALQSGLDADAGHVLAESLADQWHTDEALRTWESIAHLDCADQLRATIAVSHASLLNFRLGRTTEALAVLHTAASKVREPRALAMIDSTLGVFRTTGGAPLQSESTIPDTSSQAQPDTPFGALATSIDQATRGELDAAVETVSAAMTTADEWATEFPSIVLYLQLVASWARAMSGDLRELDAESQARYAAAVANRAEFPRAAWCAFRGWLAVLQGLPRVARVTLTEGIALSGNDRGWVRPLHTCMAMVASLEGDHVGAVEHLRVATDANRIFDAVFGRDVDRAEAWISACRGETSTAIDLTLTAAEQAAAADQAVAEAMALHDVCRFGGATRVSDRLAALAARIDGAMVTAFADHARAIAASDGRALDGVAEEFSRLGLDLFSAEASAAAARAHGRNGRKASSYASRVRAEDLVRASELTLTPALVWVDQPVELTPREREVADLAASGLLSRHIARQLGIATRTVDNILGHVYAKLGVSGRHELAAAIGTRRHE